MISGKIQDALNGQINAEMYSAYLYLSMSAHFHSTNMTGFAGWMKSQGQEELSHAMKLYEYVNERGGRVTLSRVEAPPQTWASPLAALEDAYRHEQQNTGQINGLLLLATKEGDHATAIFLQWFVTEQVEEESTANRLVERLRLVGDSVPGLLLMDRELAQRV